MEGQQADQQRMKTLLVEAIATLCKNGLNYEQDLSVEGLIGITVDKRDVFLVSVKETFNLHETTPTTDDSIKEAEISDKKDQNYHRKSSKRKGSDEDDDAVDNKWNKRLNRSETDYNSEFPEDPTSEPNNLTNHNESYEQQGDNEDDSIYYDPNLQIKQEIIKGEKPKKSCMFESNSNTHIEDSSEPRNIHPSGLNNDQLTALYKTPIVKQEKDTSHTHSSYHRISNSMNTPLSMNSQLSKNSQSLMTSPLLMNSPVSQLSPVRIYATASASKGLRSPDGVKSSVQGYPVDWGNFSGSEFMMGDESMEQTSSHKVSVSGGASQQMVDPYFSIMPLMRTTSQGRIYKCTHCPKEYSTSHGARCHIVTAHIKFRYSCDRCKFECTQKQNLNSHMKTAHGAPLPNNMFLHQSHRPSI